MIRRTAILGLLCAALAAPGGAGSAPAPPNFIFVLSDDHRWDSLGAAGNPRVMTPNLDRLAREGMHLLQATMPVPQYALVASRFTTSCSRSSGTQASLCVPAS